MPRVKEAVRRWWLSQLIGGLQFAIQPDEVPTVQAVGPAPYRVLLLGGGVSVGLGVSRRVVALPGHLARHLAAITGRGVDVHVCAWLGMTISDARAEVSRTDVSEYDAIVVALGVADLLALGSSETWRRESEQLLSGLLQRSPRARVVVIGVDTTFWSPYVHPAVTRAAGHRVGQFNAISRELCWGLARASYLRAPPKQSAPNTHHSVADYERCGRAVAAHLAERLMPAAAVPASTSGGADPGSGVTLDDLGLLDLPFDAVVAHVVARVRSVFGVEGSSLTRLGPQDAARNSMALSAGRATSDGPPSLALATIGSSAGLAVRDLRADDRFRDNRLVSRHGMAFFAGCGVQALDGEFLAVLGIFDPRPRTFSDQEMSLLRDHARLIEQAFIRTREGAAVLESSAREARVSPR